MNYNKTQIKNFIKKINNKTFLTKWDCELIELWTNRLNDLENE